MKQNSNFTLALEAKPNSFEPLIIFNNLKEIDNLTSLYDEDELNKLLYEQHLIDQSDWDVKKVIIFNNNGIRKIKDGILYKNEAMLDINLFVKNFFTYFQSDGDAINELYQFINSKKAIDLGTKAILKSLNDYRKENDSVYHHLLLELDNIPYFDLRTIYLYLIRVLIPKINKKREYTKSHKIS